MSKLTCHHNLFQPAVCCQRWWQGPVSCEVIETVAWSHCVCESYFREVKISEASTEMFWFFFQLD